MRPLLAPKALFDEAIALLKSGDLPAAEGRCRSALEAYPRDVNMLALLGALMIKANRLAEAEPLLLEAIAQAPTFASRTKILAIFSCSKNARWMLYPISSALLILTPRWRTRGLRSARRSRRWVAAPRRTRPSRDVSRCRPSAASWQRPRNIKKRDGSMRRSI